MAGKPASTGQPLPNRSAAVVPRAKVFDYLLNPEHEDGAPKERFFTAFGFSRGEWQALAAALAAHGKTNPISHVEPNRFGPHYVIDAPMLCPDGRSPVVRTVWIIEDGADYPRLVSAYPA